MAPRSKAQSARPGYNKFGFKVTKAGSGVSAPKKSSSEQKTADAQAPKVEKTLKTAIGRPAKDSGRQVVPSAARGDNTAPASTSEAKTRSAPDATPAALVAPTANRVSETVPPLALTPSLASSTIRQPVRSSGGNTIDAGAASSKSSAVALPAKRADPPSSRQVVTKDLAFKMSTLAAGDVSRIKKRKHLRKQTNTTRSKALSTSADRPEALSQSVGLTLHHRIPHPASDASVTSPFQPTPEYLRQLKDAAQTSLRDIEDTSLLGSDTNVSTELSLLPNKPGKRALSLQIEDGNSSNAVVHGRAGGVPPSSLIPHFRRSRTSSTSADGFQEGLGNETLSALTITSTPPKLSASSEQYEEYVITTTYRVPRHVISEPPLVSVSVALPSRRVTPKIGGDVVSMSEDSRTVESSGLRSTMRTGTATGNKRSLQPAPVTTSSPSRSRRKLPRNRTPTPFHRGNPFHRMTPVRHTTPARRLTPPRRTPSTRPAARSRPPTLFKGTTPIRKAHWTKSISNMAKINHRSNLLLRHRTFTLPLKEPITIMRLELFWSILSDLIAHRKLFVGSMWEHWEYIGPCVQKINEKLEKEEWFGMEESCAAVRELQRQRLVMFTGGGKVMLTRNAV